MSSIFLYEANMICQSCSHRLSLFSIRRPGFARSFSASQGRARPSDPPPATSTSAAQPFSTPFTPSPSKTPGVPPKSLSKSQEPVVLSSVPAGTPLKGLGYVKGQEAPLAKEDSEYPSWLWGLLDMGAKTGEVEGQAGDAFGRWHDLALLDL